MTTVSHHMLRRRARARRKQLIDLQRAAGGRGIAAIEAVDALQRAGVRITDRLSVEEAQRGPWRWRVVRVLPDA